jgi:hypothetical protein
MLNRRDFLLATAAGSIGVTANAAEARIRDARTISSTLPLAAGEIKALHDGASGFSAEQLPADEAPEITHFVPFLTKADEIEAARRLPNTCTRRHAISVGLEMLGDDKKLLPALSGAQILDYLKSNYVSVQARVYREPVSRALYLGSRTLVATRKYRGSKLTQPFDATVGESVNNMRSLGLLLPGRLPPTPPNLRTLVLVHKNQLSQDDKRGGGAKTNFEYLFIRALPAGPDQFDLHAFATSDERTRFHWLKPAPAPAIPSDCSVRGAVHFTEYSHQGLYPKNAVIRRSLITAQKTFGWESVENYARKEFDLRPMECIIQIMDAIIAGSFKEADVFATPSSTKR